MVNGIALPVRRSFKIWFGRFISISFLKLPMERLTSSPSPLAYRASVVRPRLLFHRAAPGTAAGSAGLRIVPRYGSKTVAACFSKQEGPSPLACSSPSDRKFLVLGSEEMAGQSQPSTQLAMGRGFADPVLKKVAPGAIFVLLSALIATIIQTIVASPSYATIQSSANTGGRLIRTELLSSAWTGFLAGCLHTLSGPDHLAALTPLSIGRSRIGSAVVGALWGCGHDAGQVIFGLLFLLLKDRLHIEIIRTWGTRVVGLTLLVIGAMGIREASEVPTPCVALENGECDVSYTKPIEAVRSGEKKIGFATFATGIVHGLQPDALLMVLPALALPSRIAGAAFLGMFLVGTVFSMGSYTAFIGSCSQALKGRIPRITEKLTWVASLVAICVGVAILISQFFGYSLY